MWFAPVGMASILLRRLETMVDKQIIWEYERNLQYIDNAPTPGLYNIQIQFPGFGYFTYSLRNMYSDWRALGQIGGFAYFLTLGHALFMIIIGFFFVNKSSFLNKSSSAPASEARHEYSPIEEPRSL